MDNFGHAWKNISLLLHPMRPYHSFCDVVHGSAFGVTGQQLCVFTQYFWSPWNGRGACSVFFLFYSPRSNPLLHLKWQAAHMWPCNAERDRDREGAVGVDALSFIYGAGSSHDWQPGIAERSFSPHESLRLSHTQDAVTNTQSSAPSTSYLQNVTLSGFAFSWAKNK